MQVSNNTTGMRIQFIISQKSYHHIYGSYCYSIRILKQKAKHCKGQPYKKTRNLLGAYPISLLHFSVNINFFGTFSVTFQASYIFREVHKVASSEKVPRMSIIKIITYKSEVNIRESGQRDHSFKLQTWDGKMSNPRSVRQFDHWANKIETSSPFKRQMVQAK